MTEQEIKSNILEELNQGTTKSVLYNQFQGTINDKSLRKFLASRPSYKLKLKFKKAHLLLSIIWGFFILLELIGISDLIVSFDIKIFISLILSIYLTVNIWKFDGRFFLPGIFWFGFTIINLFSELDTIAEYDSDYGIVLIIICLYSLILIIGIYLMYNIRKHVFGYYNWLESITNQDDEIQFEKQETDGI